MSTIQECKEILSDRDWLNVYQATKKSPLSFNALLALGFLRRKRKAATPPDYKTIAEGTGINRARAVPACIKELVTHELAIKEGGGYRPIDPGKDHESWFAQRKGGKGPRYFRVYIRKTKAPMMPIANVLYWLMVNLDSQPLHEGTRLLRQSKSGLAMMLGVNRETVRLALRKLETLNLYSPSPCGGLVVHPPKDTVYWIERKGLLKGSTPGTDLNPAEPGPRYFGRMWPHVVGDEEFRGFLATRLAESWHLLRASGYWQSDVTKFLTFVGRNVKDIHHALSYLAATLPEHLAQADAYHTKKAGRYRCSLYVLKALASKRGFLLSLPKDGPCVVSATPTDSRVSFPPP